MEPVVILRSDQLSRAQNAVKALKALWPGAVYLARGRRRETVHMMAVSLILLGIALLVVRRLGGNAVVDNLVQAESLEAAAADAWSIFTSLLAESAAAGILVGAVTLVGTWLAGPTRRARALRRWLAPPFRARPALPHLVLTLALLLALLWWPTGTPRRFITVVIVAVLAFVGLELLHGGRSRSFRTLSGAKSARSPGFPGARRPECRGRADGQARTPRATRGPS